MTLRETHGLKGLILIVISVSAFILYTVSGFYYKDLTFLNISVIFLLLAVWIFDVFERKEVVNEQRKLC